jgi:hypothetical protein
MECDYTHLNHNSLTSQNKNGQQGRDYKGGLLYMTCKSDLNVNHLHLHV